MRIEERGEQAFRIEFENEEELRAEERAHLAVGGLLVPTSKALATDTAVTLTLQVSGGPAVESAARVVAALPGALALHLEGDPSALVAALLARDPDATAEEPEGSLWERLRKLTPPQKQLLAPKAERMERAVLVQECDPQVLFALLKNPRLTLDEVARIAKSSFLSFQAAELILKTTPWVANLDVKLALMQNPKFPLPFALRLLPTLPDKDVRAIAKGAATSMALKQAALKRIQGG